MKTTEMASATPKTWNKKNMPSDVERFEESPGKIAGLVQQLPSAAVDLVRRRRGVVMASIAALGAFGLLWYFSKRD